MDTGVAHVNTTLTHAPKLIMDTGLAHVPERGLAHVSKLIMDYGYGPGPCKYSSGTCS